MNKPKMEKEEINEEFIKKVKIMKEKRMFSSNNIDIPSNINYQTFLEAVRCGLPLRFVPKEVIDFDMAKLSINNHFNNVIYVHHNILNQELFDLALSQRVLPHLLLLQKYIPSQYLTNEVYEKYLRKNVNENLQYVPERNRIELQPMIDEINVNSQYGRIMDDKSEKEKLFKNFDKIEEKEKNILFQVYPNLKEEYQQFIYQENYLEVKDCIQNAFPYGVTVDEMRNVINKYEYSEEQKQKLWLLFEEKLKNL